MMAAVGAGFLTAVTVCWPVARASHRQVGHQPRRHFPEFAAMAMVATLLVAAGLGNAAHAADASTGQDPATIRAAVAALAERQSQLLDQQFAVLKPSQPHRRELYLMAVAGDAGQGVFRREVQSVTQIFADRFGTANRTIELINSLETVAKVPLANPANMETALKRLGGVMDKADDVLFLYLTSHGGPGHFALRFGAVPMTDLTPRALRAMLDRSGIKNRVIVISACFSGSFMRDLAGPTTLVITAARADRTSFGCSDERDWTYFGDAYFNHAIAGAGTFVQAFETAKKLVAGWEERDAVTPSEPQIGIGRKIESVLAQLPMASAAQK